VPAAAAAALADAGAAPQLVALDASFSCGLPYAGLTALAAGCSSLEKLALKGEGVSLAALAAVPAAPGLKRLRELELTVTTRCTSSGLQQDRVELEQALRPGMGQGPDDDQQLLALLRDVVGSAEIAQAIAQHLEKAVVQRRWQYTNMCSGAPSSDHEGLLAALGARLQAPGMASLLQQAGLPQQEELVAGVPQGLRLQSQMMFHLRGLSTLSETLLQSDADLAVQVGLVQASVHFKSF
jgi:hypothetical protein